MTSLSPRSIGLLLVFSAGVLWSTVGLGIRLIDDAMVWQILLYRSASLTVFLGIVIALQTRANPVALIFKAGLPTVIAAVSLVGAYTGGIYAIQVTSVANAMLLFGAAPFMAALLGLLILKERVGRVTWLSIGVAMIGVTVMVADKTTGGALSGSIAALASAFGFAVFTVALRWGKSGNMLPSVFLSGIIGVVVMSVICVSLDLPLQLSINDAGISMAMGMFQIGAGLVLYTFGSRTVSAAELTLLSMSEGILAPVWVWIILGETATKFTVIGGAILFGAIAVNALFGGHRRHSRILEGKAD
ncbi:DMT family transporter [Sneathiella marina]|uniref:DMT family transporter n=1 Tax=Sneathiella marina TaxID=2950108 RepID=A0ABY4W4M4_9PROT|nr:DMT family transporter [Sneathiella marina]USG61983.1 DMT family transporter [Sneathiella marina]